ncbi:MAG: response regulator, partial [Victivallales bacterium]|nr:response regulator [Victivallales bacterium]
EQQSRRRFCRTSQTLMLSMNKRHNLLVPCLFAMLALLFAAVLAFNHIYFIGQVRRNTIARAENSLRQSSASIARFMVKAEGTADITAFRISKAMASGADDAELKRIADELSEDFKAVYGAAFRNVFTGRQNWLVMSGNWRQKENFDPSKRDWYRKAMTYPNKAVIASPYHSADDGKTIITVAKAIGDERKTVVGIDIAIEALQPLVDAVSVNDMRDCMMIAPNGYILYRNHSDADGVALSQSALKKISERALAHSGSFFFKGDSGRTLALSVSIHADWRVVVIAKPGVLRQTDFRLRMFCALMTCGFAVIALIYIGLVLYRFHVDDSNMIETEAVSRAKSTFLLNMSHDIRTPMNAIIGFTNLALEHVNDTAKVNEYLKKTAVANEHMLSLLNDILDMSRIESGNIQLEEDPCDIRSLLNDCEVVMRGQAEAKEQKFTMELHEVHGTPVICDRLRLQQVIVNLTRNAIKYTQKGGEIKVIARQLNSWKGKIDFEFSVQDNGPGISPEMQRELFKPLARDFATGSKKTDGAGLGLAITKNIVTLMGGQLTVNSDPGLGSTFIVKLPLRLAKTPTKASEDANETDGDKSSKCILLVEDNEANRGIAVELLKDMGYKYDIANNGMEAVEKFSSAPSGTYALILMDVQTPVMDGHEATRKIRSLGRPDSSTIPIIAMAANAFDGDRAAAISAGMNELLTKPVQPDILAPILKKYI